MTLFDELIDNREFFTGTLLSLISDEGKRICKSKLASQKEVNKFLYYSIKEGNDLGALHLKLSSVKLPGDFNIIAESRLLTKSDLLGLDDLEKSFEDECPEEKEEATEALEALEEHISEDKEQHAEDCACDGCVESEMTLATAVNDQLAKIAYSLGCGGNHEAAYLVEKTIESITVLASNRTLLNEV